MDFLKTLMLYMSLTFAGSMQAAPIPEPTQVPTPTPYVEQTIAPTENPLAAVTAELPVAQVTPEPTEAPAPTITPNTRYTNVRQGQRGADVKKLQNRLIELGYLPKGSADGAFGGQTRKALIAFQEANGLTADGVAGDATQTHLYENPDVKPHPSLATPTPEPTATPEPTIVPPDAPLTTVAPTEIPPVRTHLDRARIVYNDNSAPLSALHQEDGVTVASNPRVYLLPDGRIQLSIDDLVASIDDWHLTTDGKLVTLSASGYIASMLKISGVYSCMVDGQSLSLDRGDIFISEGETFVTTAFLQKAFGADVIWDNEESTLILRLQPKEQAQDND